MSAIPEPRPATLHGVGQTSHSISTDPCIGADTARISRTPDSIPQRVDANGAVLWTRRLGSGGTLGGVHWGIAAAPDAVLVPNSDRELLGNPEDEPRPGLAALDPATGEELWFKPHVAACPEERDGCRAGLSAASVAGPGFVVAGGLDGVVEARAIDDGRLLWSVQTARDWETVNGVSAMGGAIDGPQLVLADDWLFVNSGYAMFDQMYGNVLLAFRPKAATQD